MMTASLEHKVALVVFEGLQVILICQSISTSASIELNLHFGLVI